VAEVAIPLPLTTGEPTLTTIRRRRRSVSGQAREVELQLTLRPIPRFRFEQTYIYSSLKTDTANVFNNPIMRWKLNYQFTRELSLRAILDYEAVLPNTALVDLEKEKLFTADILLTYLLNPSTALYVGYTDGYENLELTATAPRELRRTDSSLNSTGRQVFVRVELLMALLVNDG
jgi:predicted porin